MLLYRCPAGHTYGIAGCGEDLTAGMRRVGTRVDCPACTPIDTGETARLKPDHTLYEAITNLGTPTPSNSGIDRPIESE